MGRMLLGSGATVLGLCFLGLSKPGINPAPQIVAKRTALSDNSTGMQLTAG